MDYGGKRILKHYTLVENNRGLSRGETGGRARRDGYGMPGKGVGVGLIRC